MHRINALRAALKRENHPDWEQLYRCGVHRDTGDRRTLILAPRDSEFRSVLKDAGVTVNPIPEVKEFTIKTPSPDSVPSVDDFLSDLRDATTIPKKAPGG
jgi:hypothetical protein